MTAINETELYRIQYTDNTYQYIRWTEEEFEYVADMMCGDVRSIVINKCIFKVSDVRAIVHIPVEDQSDTEKHTHIVETEEGSFDKDLYSLLLDTGMISPEEKGGKS